jgi:hypothetical protein
MALYEHVGAFHRCDALGPRALPATELVEHVEEELVEVCGSGEIVLVADQGLLAVVFRTSTASSRNLA